MTRIVERLREARPAPGAPPPRVFFDTAEIRGMDDWRQRLRGALRRSRVLLICLSPAWATSEWCRLERSEFRRMRHERRNRVPESLAVVRLSDIALDNAVRDDTDARAAVDDVGRSQFLLDLAPWFADAQGKPRAPAPEAFDEWPNAVATIRDHLHREREAQRAQGNLRAGNRAFVGREKALQDLHLMVAHGKPGNVSVVQGLGGIGKSELALQYGLEYAWHYTGGLWMVDAEGER